MTVADSITDVFVKWLSNDVLPYFAASWDLTILLLSIILNILLLVTFKKRKLFSQPSNYLMLNLILTDILSWFIVLIPGAVVALRKQWDLTDYFCYTQAVGTSWLYLTNCAFIVVLVIERTVKSTRERTHKSSFGSGKKIATMSIFIHLLCMGVSVIPVTGWGSISYDFYHASCTVRHEHNLYYLIVLVMSGIGVALIGGFIGFVVIFKSRKKILLKEKEKKEKKDAELARSKKHRNLETIKEIGTSNTESSQSSSGPNKPTMPTSKVGWDAKSGNGKGTTTAPKQTRRRSSVAIKEKNTFDDDSSDPDFHLSITYFIMWTMILVLWIPYFLIALYDHVDPSTPLWRGFYSIGVLVAISNFCIKPIVYISHNRHFQKSTKETLPESLVERASAVRSSFSQVANRLDQLVFNSKPKPSIQATVKAKVLASKWMKKASVKPLGTATTVTKPEENTKVLIKTEEKQKEDNESTIKASSPKPPEVDSGLPGTPANNNETDDSTNLWDI